MTGQGGCHETSPERHLRSRLSSQRAKRHSRFDEDETTKEVVEERRFSLCSISVPAPHRRGKHLIPDLWSVTQWV